MGNRKTIIIADDKGYLLDLMEMVFVEAFPDYEIEPYKSGHALEQRLNQPVNGTGVIVLDNAMPPGPTGGEIVRKYAGKPGYEDIPFILHYADDEGIGKRAVEDGARAYVLKGDVFGLVDKVKEVLSE